MTSDEPVPAAPLAAPLAARPGSDLRCTAWRRKPGRRYPSALALAEDLERFREGKQVDGAAGGRGRAAGPRLPAPAARRAVARPSRRLAVGGAGWRDLEVAGSERTTGPGNACKPRRADDEKQAALYQAYRASLAAASAALENHDVADADRHLKAAPEALLGWEWRHLRSRLDDSSAVVPLPAGEGASLIAGPDRLLPWDLDQRRLADHGPGAVGRLSAVHAPPSTSSADRPRTQALCQRRPDHPRPSGSGVGR